MNLFATILQATAPVFGLLLVGAFFRSRNWLNPDTDQRIMQLLLNVFYPALIVTSIIGNKSLSTGGNVIAAPVIGAVTILLGLFFCLKLSPLFGMKLGSDQRTFAFSAGIYNYGYTPIYLIQNLYPDSDMIGVLFVHNLGVELVFWSIGILILTGGLGKNWAKKLLSPPLLGLFLGLFINLSGLHGWLSGDAPALFSASYKVSCQIVSALGGCAVTLGIVVCGSSLWDAAKSTCLWKQLNVSLAACVLRLGLLPLFFLAIAVWAPISHELKVVVIIQSAMPSALFPFVLIRYYGANSDIGLRTVLSTTLVSLVTIPLWISLGLWLIA